MPIWPYVALFTAGLAWGLGFPMGKLALASVDAPHMILLRFAVAGLAAAPLALRRRQGRRLFASPAILLGGLFMAIGFLVQFEGLARTSVALCALLIGLMPAMIAAVAALTGERVGAVAWAGIGSATAGAVLIAGRPGGASLTGVLLCFFSMPVLLGWVFATRRAPAGAWPVEVSCATIVICAVVLAPMVMLLHGAPRLDLPPVAWAAIAGQGLLSSVVATIAWQSGAPRVSSAAAGVFINIEPAVGTAIGIGLFHDRLTAAATAGGALILVGSLAVVLGERRSARRIAGEAPTPA